MRRSLAQLAIALAAIVLASGCASPGSAATSAKKMSLEESFIFIPSRFPEGNWDVANEDFEDAWFASVDGPRLHGWLAEAKQPKNVVLYCHGNAGNITHRKHVLWLFRDKLNASILVFDYRGYGKSKGVPSELGILADARAARQWLAKRAKVAEADVVIVGNSLGGAVAVDLAAKDGARGLVLENTFTSMPDVAAVYFGLAAAFVKTRLDSKTKIKNYKGPLLQTHGDADEVIPFDLGKKLFAAANEPKQFIHIAGGRHNDPPTKEYLKALEAFLRKLPREK